MEESLDENQELPSYFLSEIYKWALECKYDLMGSYNLLDLSIYLFISAVLLDFEEIPWKLVE